MTGADCPNAALFWGPHAYLGAPYGIYRTTDGYLALAMTPSLEKLCDLLGVVGLESHYGDPGAMLAHRDLIKRGLANRIETESTTHWLNILQPADIWCSEVLNWKGIARKRGLQGPGFRAAPHPQ